MSTSDRMPATGSYPLLAVLAGLAWPAAACSSHAPYDRHAEPPMVSEVRLTPQHDILRVRATLEPHAAEPSDAEPEQWSVTDQVNASFTVRWINLGPDPAPSVVELRGHGLGLDQPLAIIVRPNHDTSFSLSGAFDYDQCAAPCIVDLEFAWHHASTGELQVEWSVSATRSGYREHPSSSYGWDYALTPFEIVVQGPAPVVAADPDSAP